MSTGISRRIFMAATGLSVFAPETKEEFEQIKCRFKKRMSDQSYTTSISGEGAFSAVFDRVVKFQRGQSCGCVVTVYRDRIVMQLDRKTDVIEESEKCELCGKPVYDKRDFWDIAIDGKDYLCCETCWAKNLSAPACDMEGK